MGPEVGDFEESQISPQEWLARLTVKVENNENSQEDRRYDVQDNARKANGSLVVRTTSPGRSASRKCRGNNAENVERRKVAKGGRSEAPKEERLLTPEAPPVYTPALAPSQLPFGFSQVVKTGESALSAEQLQLVELTGGGATGLWRMHAKSGIKYRKGPFSLEERLLVEEALEQYAQREGLESVEEAVRSLSGNVGRKFTGRFHTIAKCLPERPFVSIYGYVRRRINGSVKRGRWTKEETKQLVELVEKYPPRSMRGRWVKIGALLNRRPADACDKWRGLQPHLPRGGDTAALPALEDQRREEDGGGNAHKESTGDKFLVALPAEKAGHLDGTQRQLLLDEVRKRTGEELPAFGIPWSRIQQECFPYCEHAVLRRIYTLALVPVELERRMGTKPRPVILRHILRSLRRLDGRLPLLRVVEWLDLLPFVPPSLQVDILRNAATAVLKDRKPCLDAALPQLFKEHESSLECMRKKDASLLLKGTLPVSVQQTLEAAVLAKAVLKGWPKSTVRKKLRRSIRKAAAEELNRLKTRLLTVRGSPLNAPCRGEGQQHALADGYNKNKVLGSGADEHLEAAACGAIDEGAQLRAILDKRIPEAPEPVSRQDESSSCSCSLGASERTEGGTDGSLSLPPSEAEASDNISDASDRVPASPRAAPSAGSCHLTSRGASSSTARSAAKSTGPKRKKARMVSN